MPIIVAPPPAMRNVNIPLTLGFPRLDNPKLLRSLRLLELCSWADLTSRASDGSRTWLDLPTLLPDMTLSPYPPVPQPWPGDPASTRPGQFWRLTRGPGDWAWGGIHQIIAYLPTDNVLTLQRWTEGRLRSLTRSGHSFSTSLTDFTDRCSHRVLVHPSRSPGKGTLRAEFPDTPQLTPSPGPSWVDALRPLDPTISWSIYTDASWRAVRPPQAQAVFGLQGSHHGRGALFITADHPDWCSDILALHFEIPPTPPSLGGTAQVAELLAIQAGLHLLHSRHLRGTVFSDCLGAVKKISRRWSTGRSFLEAGAALVMSSRAALSEHIQLKWIKGHPERSDVLPAAWTRQQWGIYMADALAKSRSIGSLPHSPIPFLQSNTIPFHNLLTAVPPASYWHWAGPVGHPPLGNLRAMLSHHRARAYRTNRDALRAQRDAPPIWMDTLQTVGAKIWLHRSQPLRKRVQALRTHWDLRWHGENQAVAAKTEAPEVSSCPICHRFWSQAHVLGDCPSTADARTGGSLDLTLAVSRLPPGPMLELGRKFQALHSPGAPLGRAVGPRGYPLPPTRNCTLHS